MESKSYSQPPIVEAVVELRFRETLSNRDLQRTKDKFKQQFPAVEERRTISVTVKGTQVDTKSDLAGVLRWLRGHDEGMFG